MLAERARGGSFLRRMPSWQALCSGRPPKVARIGSWRVPRSPHVKAGGNLRSGCPRKGKLFPQSEGINSETAERLAKQHNKSRATIERDAKFCRACAVREAQAAIQSGLRESSQPGGGAGKDASASVGTKELERWFKGQIYRRTTRAGEESTRASRRQWYQSETIANAQETCRSTQSLRADRCACRQICSCL
jgi:hypothetical protein